MIAKFISDYFYYILLAMIFFTFLMRRKKNVSRKKRLGMLFLSIAVFLLYIYAVAIIQFKLDDMYVLLYFVVVIPIFIIFKKQLFPFTKIRCEECNEYLSFTQIIYFDSVKCQKCDPPVHEKKSDSSGKKTD